MIAQWVPAPPPVSVPSDVTRIVWLVQAQVSTDDAHANEHCTSSATAIAPVAVAVTVVPAALVFVPPTSNGAVVSQPEYCNTTMRRNAAEAAKFAVTTFDAFPV